MESKNGKPTQSLRTSERVRKRPKYFNRGYLYYQPVIRKKMKSKRRTAASQIAKKILTPQKPSGRTIPDSANLRRSTRKRKVSINLEDYTNRSNTSSSEDDDLMAPMYRPTKNKSVNNSNHDVRSPYLTRKNKRLPKSNNAPRREGLRPRRTPGGRLLRIYQESGDEEEEEEDDDEEEEGDTSETDDKGAQNENGNSNGENGNEEEEEEADGGDEAEEEEEEDDDEQEGRRRYDLRDRSEVRRPSPEKGEKQRAPRSPRRVLHHGMGLAGPRNGR